jgi:acyl-CoA synthetase (AMP-forming)/AMP-acid ligase II
LGETRRPRGGLHRRRLFSTGDVGYVDEDGYLFIVDRKKDIIIRGGEKYSAAEVEAALYGCEGVAEAAVFGAADERLGKCRSHPPPPRGQQPQRGDLRAFLEGGWRRSKFPSA